MTMKAYGNRTSVMVWSLALSLVVAVPAAAQRSDDGFNPLVNGVVKVVVQDPSTGRFLIGGDISVLNGAPVAGLARINGDGSTDTGFQPGLGPDSDIRGALVDTDGSVVFGGELTTVGGQPRSTMARVDQSGAVDLAFAPDLTGSVFALAWDLDRSGIYVAGGFEEVGGGLRQVRRLTTSGALDPGFVTPQFGFATAYAVAVQADGKVLIGGSITAPSGMSGNGLFRLHPDGSPDTDFNVVITSGDGIAPTVRAILIQDDGGIVIGGHFDSVNGASENALARLRPDGSLDTGFNPPTIDGTVFSLASHRDGRFVVAGNFSSGSAERVLRLNFDGNRDLDFADVVVNPSIVYAAMVSGDDRILLGGTFNYVNGIVRTRLARLEPDGTLEQSLSADVVGGAVEAVALQRDGKVLVGGRFTEVAGQPRERLARLLPSGELDSSFDTALNSDVYTITVMKNRQIMIGGGFATVDGAIRRRLARLNADGALDGSFDAQIPAGFVRAVAIYPDSDMIIGGSFTEIAGQPRERLARLIHNGNLDLSFAPTAVNGTVRAIAIMPDQRIVIGGDFSEVGGQPRQNIARLNPDGTLDSGFNPDANAPVWSLLPTWNGALRVGGDFTQIGGQNRSRYAQLVLNGAVQAVNPAPNGRVATLLAQNQDMVYLGGSFLSIGGQARSRVALLDVATVMDWQAPVIGTVVNSGALQADGKLLLGGTFSNVGAQPRANLARLSTANPVRHAMHWDQLAGRIEWQVTGDFPQVQEADLIYAIDCCGNFPDNTVGMSMTRVDAGHWRYDGFHDPEGPIYMRVRVRTVDGKGGGNGIVLSPIFRFIGKRDQIFFGGFDPVA